MNQETREMIKERYERAKAIGFSGNLALNDVVIPRWLKSEDRFWYIRDEEGGGHSYRMVDPVSKTNEPAINLASLADALAEETKESIDPLRLPISCEDFSSNGDAFNFSAYGREWTFQCGSGELTEARKRPGNGEQLSPDGKLTAFVRNFNLWVRCSASGKETCLTTVGDEDFDFATIGKPWGVPPDPSPPIEVLWSSDSKRLLTVRSDRRPVKELPVVHYTPQDGCMRPVVKNVKIAYPGDEHVECWHILVINIETGIVQNADYPAFPITRNGVGLLSSGLAWWGADDRYAYFVDVDRYYKFARLVEFDTKTGATRVVFEEIADTKLTLMQNGDMSPNIFAIPESDELLWYSDRTGWGHLYLYCTKTGDLKNAVTSGDWLVRDVVKVDAERREVFLQTASRIPGRNPYFRDLVRVCMDTGELTEIASGDHDVFASAHTDLRTGLAIAGGVSPRRVKNWVAANSEYLVLTRTRVDQVPESVVVCRDGSEVMSLETGNFSRVPVGWRFPELVDTISADCETIIYGTLFKPSYFSEDKKYPVILCSFVTPDFPSASYGFLGGEFFGSLGAQHAISLAELGFVVVQLDGRGASYRDKRFSEVAYGSMLSSFRAAMDDIVAGIRQLGADRPYMDLNRVGLWTYMGGGGAVEALTDYSDLFKVSVSNYFHDERAMGSSMWGDMFEGEQPKEKVYPEQKVDRLNGKLLLQIGLLDTTTPPTPFFRLVDALSKANKNFDMQVLPNHGHGYSYFFTRTAWDYFVSHLLGELPPYEFDLSDGQIDVADTISY